MDKYRRVNLSIILYIDYKNILKLLIMSLIQMFENKDIIIVSEIPKENNVRMNTGYRGDDAARISALRLAAERIAALRSALIFALSKSCLTGTLSRHFPSR